MHLEDKSTGMILQPDSHRTAAKFFAHNALSRQRQFVTNIYCTRPSFEDMSAHGSMNSRHVFRNPLVQQPILGIQSAFSHHCAVPSCTMPLVGPMPQRTIQVAVWTAHGCSGTASSLAADDMAGRGHGNHAAWGPKRDHCKYVSSNVCHLILFSSIPGTINSRARKIWKSHHQLNHGRWFSIKTGGLFNYQLDIAGSLIAFTTSFWGNGASSVSHPFWTTSAAHTCTHVHISDMCTPLKENSPFQVASQQLMASNCFPFHVWFFGRRSGIFKLPNAFWERKW